jgi:hypothetical protein
MLQKICHMCGKDIIRDNNITGNIVYRCNDHYHEHYVEYNWKNDFGDRIVVHKYFDNNIYLSTAITNGQVISYLGCFLQTGSLKFNKSLIDKSNEEILELYEKLMLLK